MSQCILCTCIRILADLEFSTIRIDAEFIRILIDLKFSTIRIDAVFGMIKESAIMDK